MLKYSQTPGIFKLEGNRLGRPYHRLQTIFVSKFDTLDSRLNNYFLKKHRSYISLKRIDCEMDVSNKTAELFTSEVGQLAFDIDRPLLLTLLGNFYGLEEDLESESSEEHGLPTKTEIRLKNRLASDLLEMIFDKDSSGLALSIAPDNMGVQTQWTYKITFTLDGAEGNCFYIFLDDAHTDFVLNALRQQDIRNSSEQLDTRARKEKKQAVVSEVINTLPLTLTVKIAEISLNVAELTTIKPGDILPIGLPERYSVNIGKAELFSALLVEDKNKLYLSDIAGTKSENSYE
ncbi:FliM/FliN family flagellar motor switch protein [Scandinavium manionii]|uniref:FliM/FliN family flagellar motor switch protein n=1 Tax=Scandinavium manionii TaxID=2926520 RepID=UPI00135BAF8A|nr:FliM/FliN family flagellar motor switch protein [Scandinavium manionii]MCS2150680.1 FliM/FliN family flagellar motor switch protein [Scandinavium manionii]MCS2166906.1 FliM/FliN family flagellar motor switch protein [Scandinavium manionii]